MLGIGFGEFALVLLVLIVVLGPERLPTFMKSVGKGIRTLRNASRDIRSAVGIDELMREDFSYKPPPRRPDPPREEPSVSPTAELPAPETPTPTTGPEVDEGAPTLFQARPEAAEAPTIVAGKSSLGRTQFSPGAPPPPENPVSVEGSVPKPASTTDVSSRVSAPAPPRPGFPRPAPGAVSRADVPVPPPSAPPPAPPPSGAPPAPSEDEK